MRWNIGAAMRNTLAGVLTAGAFALPAKAEAQQVTEPFMCLPQQEWTDNAADCYRVGRVRLGADSEVGLFRVSQGEDIGTAERLGEIRVPSRSYGSLSDIEMRLLDPDYGAEQAIFTHRPADGVYRGDVFIEGASELRLGRDMQVPGTEPIRLIQDGPDRYRIPGTDLVEWRDQVSPDAAAVCVTFEAYDGRSPQAAIGGVMQVNLPTQADVDKGVIDTPRPPIDCAPPPTTIPTPPTPVPPPPPPFVPEAPAAPLNLFGAAGPIYKVDRLDALRREHEVCLLAEGFGLAGNLAYIDADIAGQADALFAPGADACDHNDNEFSATRYEGRGMASLSLSGPFGAGVHAEAFRLGTDDAYGTSFSSANIAALATFRSAGFVLGAGPAFVRAADEATEISSLGGLASVDYISPDLRANVRGYGVPVQNQQTWSLAGGVTFTPLDVGPVSLGVQAGARYDYLCDQFARDNHTQGYLGLAIGF